MQIFIHALNGEKIAEIAGKDIILNTPQDALELIMDPELQGARRLILRKEHIAPGFFDLRTKLAGEIMQKFVNYQTRLAVIGDFESGMSDAFRAFVRESNRGNRLLFLADIEEAKKLLTMA
jgi:hypothetical protein